MTAHEVERMLLECAAEFASGVVSFDVEDGVFTRVPRAPDENNSSPR
jgi:hypothetical protein